MEMVEKYKPELGVRAACDAFGIPESTWYRWVKINERSLSIRSSDAKKPYHHRRLKEDEEEKLLSVMCELRFMDMAPETIVACLLDEGKYYGSARTMYRLLDRHKAVKERRNQLKHPEYKKPELLATMPNQVWTWDITKLRTGRKHDYLHLYVIIDVFSRYTVGWLVADRECSKLAEKFIADTCWEQRIKPGQLTIHADRGTSMRSKTVAQMMADMGVTRSHSRPYVSNDNPYSESQFKTLKYGSDFPKFFRNVDEAKEFLEEWFRWYNTKHRHSGIQMLTPENVHYGKDKDVLKARNYVMMKAYKKYPERFSRGKPKLRSIDSAVYINKPKAA